MSAITARFAATVATIRIRTGSTGNARPSLSGAQAISGARSASS